MYRSWLNNIDKKKRILEIGPLCWPNIKKEDGVNIFYADIRSTEDVKKFYKNHQTVPNEKIVDIDFVITEKGYSESLRNIEKFDYVIATHVIEHIPQLILFFQDIAGILNPQGKLCLSIPDKRYCFDHYRCPTSFAECYDVYIKQITNLPLRVLEHCSLTSINDPVFWWKNMANFEHLSKEKERFDNAKNIYHRALNGEYHDVHFSVFTPESFLLLIYNMLNFNLFPFSCIDFSKTAENTFEFDCVLEYEPNNLIEGSMEIVREKDNLIKLLSENFDLYYSNTMIKKLETDLQNSNLMIENLKTDLQNSNIMIENLKTDLQNMLMSKSWRVTAPLRKIRRMFKRK